MSAMAVEIPKDEIPDLQLLLAAREAFLKDPHYLVDMMHAANRVRSKRRIQRDRAKAAQTGT